MTSLWLALWAVALIGLVIGFLWIGRITDDRAFIGSSNWRYRRVPRAKGEVPTPRWFATRLEMSIAILAFIAVLIAPATGFSELDPLRWLFALALSGFGTIWIFRIARHDSEASTPPWRYRER